MTCINEEARKWEHKFHSSQSKVKKLETERESWMDKHNALRLRLYNRINELEAERDYWREQTRYAREA